MPTLQDQFGKVCSMLLQFTPNYWVIWTKVGQVNLTRTLVTSYPNPMLGCYCKACMHSNMGNKCEIWDSAYNIEFDNQCWVKILPNQLAVNRKCNFVGIWEYCCCWCTSLTKWLFVLVPVLLWWIIHRPNFYSYTVWTLVIIYTVQYVLISNFFEKTRR